MQKYIICGIDAHEKTLVCRAAVDKAKPQTGRFGHHTVGIRHMVKWLEELARPHGEVNIVTGYEASSLGFGLHDSLSDLGVISHVLAPHKIRQSAEDRKKKTDERDAQRVLEELKNHYLAGSELPAVWIPDPALREDRQLVRARLEIANKITEIKTQIGTFLKVNSIVILVSTKTTWTVRYRARLQQLSESDKGLREHLRVVLGSQLRILRSYEKERSLLDKAIEQLGQDPRYATSVKALVERFKGVGLLTAMVFLTELGDMSRFANRRQIASYLGLCPSSFESGEIQNRKGHITRHGPERVRKVLNQAVWSATRWNPTEDKVYRSIMARNPNKKKIAVVACMRRLGIRMWHVARDAQAAETLAEAPAA